MVKYLVDQKIQYGKRTIKLHTLLYIKYEGSKLNASMLSY